jgi:hypothetical protein
LIAGIAGSNPAEDMEFRLFFSLVLCVGSGVCDELINPSEESYWLRVCVCVSNCVWCRKFNNEAVVAAQKKMTLNTVAFTSSQNDRKAEFPDKFD